MKPTSPPTIREQAIQWLQWGCVLPAAVLGGQAVQFLAERIVRLAISIGGTPAPSTVVSLPGMLLHLPGPAAFVFAGALTAPRGRRLMAFFLAAVGVVLSLTVHILTQPHPGATNYAHFALEALGSALGVALIHVWEKRRST